MRSIFVAGACLAALGACVQPPEAGEAYAPKAGEAEMKETRILGTLTYRQKIALPQTATATISIFRDGEAETGGEPVRQQTFALNGRQVPVPFEIVLEAVAPDQVYALAAEIRAADGELLWSSQPVPGFSADGLDEDIGMISLVPAGRSRVEQDDLTGREWMVAGLDGKPVLSTSRITISFGADGRISGNASCNAFTGSYKVNNSSLYVGPLALTRKACVPPLMDQEAAFVSLLETVSQMQIDASGTLTISGEDGETLTAR